MIYQFISYDRDGPVAVITLNQPDQFNAFHECMHKEILQALDVACGDCSVRALLFTARGRLFSAGANLGGLMQTNAPGQTRGENVERIMHTLFNKVTAGLHEFPAPVVVALNGGVAGGAVGTALAGDVLVAARSAYFYLPFVPKLGLVPDLGATWFLQRALGRARALALTLTGERWSAEQAESWGMVHAVVGDEELPATAMKLAQQLARLPAHGVIEARRAFDEASRNDLRAQLAYEAHRQSELLDLPTFEEGTRAFFEKREPRFPGR
ncbi:enoyl-CoA hydratase-related protein [Zestomonas carbonaria]|uniref:1,2-epoxyphenylacetyl-CoA isomerase n=1 Tax=Zestomonas carbonaria TaxID=2762745 RepID=A0A7U7EJJ0_9GAMM|nr:enoyl-CoA hydratase-related protein [Pseudomonas carbonaria]CAD5106174.1 1,2-epoxyphenylacetyl-CoA isomerase [Pseudomonas carbonaria]